MQRVRDVREGPQVVVVVWAFVLFGCLLCGLKSFHGSPPDFALTTSPVSKPAPGGISLNSWSLDTSKSSIDRPFAHRKIYGYVMFKSILPCAEQPWYVR